MSRAWFPPLLATLALAGCGDAPSEDTVLTWEEETGDRIDGATERAAPVRLAFTAPPGASEGGTFRFRVTGARAGQNVWIRAIDGFRSQGTCLRSLGGNCVDAASVSSWAIKGVANNRGVFEGVAALPPGSPSGSSAVMFAHTTAGTGGRVSNFERVHVFGNGNARIRVVHASPDAPPVDVYLNDQLAIADLAFRDVFSFVELQAGTYTVDIRAAGADPASRPVYSVPLALDPYTSYTAVAAGSLASSTPDEAFRVLPLVEEFASPTATSTRVRIVHAGADAPTVDIDVLRDGSSEITALARFADTGAAGVALPAAGSLPLGLAGNALPFTLPELPAGAEATVIATGLLSSSATDLPSSFGLLAVIDNSPPAFLLEDPIVYALHASPDAPPVDLKIGSSTVADDLAFRSLAGPLRPTPDSAFALDVFAADGTTYVTTEPLPALERGGRYLAVATGLLGGLPSFRVLAVDDPTPENTSQAQVTVVHASPDAPPVYVGAFVPDFASVAGPLAFGGFGPVSLPPGDYDLALSVNGVDPAISFPTLTLSEGFRGYAVATGLLGDSSFGLTVVDGTTSPWATVQVAPLP